MKSMRQIIGTLKRQVRRSALLLGLVSSFGLALPSYGLEYQYGGRTWYFTLNGGEASIYSVDSLPSGSLTVPSSVAGFPVVELGDSLFCVGCYAGSPRYLTSLGLPSSLRKIGTNCFSGQSRLRNVTIPSGVTQIGQYAFSGVSATFTFMGARPTVVNEYGYTVTPSSSTPGIFGVYSAISDVSAYYRAGASGWTNGGTWCGVTTLQEGSRLVTIRFDANGGAIRSSSQRVISGNLWGKMPTPTRNGYMFVGWYTAASGGTLVTASSAVPNYDTTYYAHWALSLSLGGSLDGTGFSWSSNGWHGQNVDTHDGVDACRCGSLCNNEQSWIQTTVNGPGTVSFWWKVSCEPSGYDALRFLVDGVQQESISGEVGWRYFSFAVAGNGTHTLKWNYTKDGSITKGQDAAWLDQVSWQDNSVTIYFNANGGYVSRSSQRVQPGNMWGKMMTPTRSGYMFVGWYTAPQGGTLITSSSLVPSYSTTYYAHWAPILSLTAALDGSGLEWSSNGWHGQNVDTHDGVDACRCGSLCNNEQSWLQTTVYGSGRVTFWWRVSCEPGGADALRFLVDGVQQESISGEIGWLQVSVPVYGSGRHTLKWNYTKNGSVTKGQDAAWVDQVSWSSDPGPISVGEAVDNYSQTFTGTWYGQSTYYYTGYDAARSAAIGNNGSSSMQTTVSGAGTLQFYWKVSSESGCDSLRVVVDGVEQDAISGEQDWTSKTVTVTGSGAHTITWTYSKDVSVSSGLDAGFVDYVRWTPTPTTKYVYFNANGGRCSYSSYSYTVGSTYGWLPTPERRDGYTFTGWYTAISGGTRITESSTVTDSVTYLYAHWTANVSLATAIDYNTYSVTTGGSASWFADSSTAYAGSYSARSGSIGASQSTYMQTTVYGAGELLFTWKVSSESSFDKLKLYIDGNLRREISGTSSGWISVVEPIVGSYSHTVKWEYSKDGSVDSGSDCAWVDGVAYSTDITAWYPVSDSTYGAILRSTDVDDDEWVSIDWSISGTGTITFDWNVSSESGWDKLNFYIDGVLRDDISGTPGWSSKSYYVGSGNHTFSWEYKKDGTQSSGSDCGWIRRITFTR